MPGTIYELTEELKVKVWYEQDERPDFSTIGSYCSYQPGSYFIDRKNGLLLGRLMLLSNHITVRLADLKSLRYRKYESVASALTYVKDDEYKNVTYSINHSRGSRVRGFEVERMWPEPFYQWTDGHHERRAIEDVYWPRVDGNGYPTEKAEEAALHELERQLREKKMWIESPSVKFDYDDQAFYLDHTYAWELLSDDLGEEHGERYPYWKPESHLPFDPNLTDEGKAQSVDQVLANYNRMNSYGDGWVAMTARAAVLYQGKLMGENTYQHFDSDDLVGKGQATQNAIIEAIGDAFEFLNRHGWKQPEDFELLTLPGVLMSDERDFD